MRQKIEYAVIKDTPNTESLKKIEESTRVFNKSDKIFEEWKKAFNKALGNGDIECACSTDEAMFAQGFTEDLDNKSAVGKEYSEIKKLLSKNGYREDKDNSTVDENKEIHTWWRGRNNFADVYTDNGIVTEIRGNVHIKEGLSRVKEAYDKRTRDIVEISEMEPEIARWFTSGDNHKNELERVYDYYFADDLGNDKDEILSFIYDDYIEDKKLNPSEEREELIKKAIVSAINEYGYYNFNEVAPFDDIEEAYDANADDISELDFTSSSSNDYTPSGDALVIADDLVYAIKDEWDTVTLYNNIISELEEASKNGQDFDDIIPVIKDIVKEENVHIGQLQKALSTISPDTDDIANGEVEAEGQLTEGFGDNSDDISDWDFACQLEPYADDGVEVAYKNTLEVDYPRMHRRKTPREMSKRRDAMERSTRLKEEKDKHSNADYIRDAWKNGYLKDDDLITYFLDKTPDDMLAELRTSTANAKKNFDTKPTADDLSFSDANTVLSDPNAKLLKEDKTSMNVSVEADSPATIKAEVKTDTNSVDTFDVVGNPEEDDLSIADVELV